MSQLLTPKPSVPLKGLELWACEWKDAHYNNGEFERHEITHRPVLYVSVGLLLQNDEEGVSIATDICETGSFRGINFIPREMVVNAWKVGSMIQRKSKFRSKADPPPTI